MTEINKPDVVEAVRQAFMGYEKAVVTNDVQALDDYFWRSEHTLRYGVNEILYGHDQIAAFRASRSAIGLDRTLANTKIVTFGDDTAVANTEFYRKGSDRVGRQSQTWRRFSDGWKIVSAHVSLME
ncbi:oxalurate catabolism protein HpxZ [Fodinicurvata sp. EGI_FJ10296]|uniref:oxalurate catabolism protein HpxZ n=1 Tax=Fodinicurvata sp. EGI_FJ10296 TaxID=3231908 RepID=UPI003451C5CB